MLYSLTMWIIPSRSHNKRAETFILCKEPNAVLESSIHFSHTQSAQIDLPAHKSFNFSKFVSVAQQIKTVHRKRSVVIESPFGYDGSGEMEDDGGIFAAVEGDGEIRGLKEPYGTFEDAECCCSGLVCGAVDFEGGVEG